MPTSVQTDSQITLRPIVDSDVEFLRQLYITTRNDIASAPFSNEEKDLLFNHQFNAQHTYYQHVFPDANFDIVLLGNTRIGRIYVDYGPSEVRVIDISILPEFRGRGFGTELLHAVLDRAAMNETPVRLRVEPDNPALKLYTRLGFRKIADEQVNWHLEWNSEDTRNQ